MLSVVQELVLKALVNAKKIVKVIGQLVTEN